jgi:hypothetical protein
MEEQKLSPAERLYKSQLRASSKYYSKNKHEIAEQRRQKRLEKNPDMKTRKRKFSQEENKEDE